MIPAVKVREVQTGGAVDTTSFDISRKDASHLMVILRDTLYSDKVLAVLREYSANAWDAMREVGKGDQPIEVKLPTYAEPTLTIRDFGPGLSHNSVFNIFTQYGASTKRENAEAVGMLGIGSKSGFAYADSFTITSWHRGTKRVYVASLDASDKGELTLLHEEKSDEERGLQIEIAVQKDDIDEFENKAKDLFRHFVPRPKINIQLPDPHPVLKNLKNGVIYDRDADNYGVGWIAIMGCIAYRVNVQQLREVESFDVEMFNKISGELHFDMGELHFNASREELKYSEQTKKKLVEKFNALVDEYVQFVLTSIESGQFTPWEKRIKAQVLNRLGLPTPDDDGELFAQWVNIKEKPETMLFTFQRNRNVTNTISIKDEVRIVIQDDRRSLKGFGLKEYDFCVKPNPKINLDDVAKQLDEILKKYALTGVTIVKLSTLPWTPTLRGSNGRPKTVNEKHHVKSFRLIPDNRHFIRPYSNYWETETEREPTKDDVFVILQNFEPGDGMFHLYRDDCRIAKAFGLKMPEVYGYKWTTAKPITKDDCVGTNYASWSAKFRDSLDKDKIKEVMGNWYWKQAIERRYYDNYSYRDGGVEKDTLKFLNSSLGADHPITIFATRALKSAAALSASGFDGDLFYTLQKITNVKMADESKIELAKLYKKYPLLNIENTNLMAAWGRNCEDWIQYIKLLDQQEKVS
jgi:hypothetical protein